MNVVEIETGKPMEKPKALLEQQTDRLVQGIVSFVLRNLPDRRFLPNLAETGNTLPIVIGQQKWTLEIKNEKRGTDEEPIRLITMTTTNPKTDQTYVNGIFTDQDFRQVIGVCLRDGTFQQVFGIPEINLIQITSTLRQAEREKVLRSLRQTHSPARTSQLQRLSQRRIMADLAYFRNHGILAKQKEKAKPKIS